MITRYMKLTLTALIVCTCFVEISSAREPLTVVKRLAGYRCIGLKAAYISGPREIDHAPPIYDSPTDRGIKITSADATMISFTPPHEVNGFTAVILPNQRQGWLKSAVVMPWHNLMSPATKCYPALMSNGLWAFDYEGGPR